MSKTIIAVRHFGLGGRESLETAVKKTIVYSIFCGLFIAVDYIAAQAQKVQNFYCAIKTQFM